VLQVAGTYVVRYFVHSDSVYGVFATVLGLLAWIYLGVEITLYAAELNVVLARRLWPRSIVQPPLTDADRTVLAGQALQNQRRDDQHVEVSFDNRPADVTASGKAPRAPGQVGPPAEPEAADGNRGGTHHEAPCPPRPQVLRAGRPTMLPHPVAYAGRRAAHAKPEITYPSGVPAGGEPCG
jgi:virulence factor BrkB